MVEPADPFGILAVEGPHGDLVNGFTLVRVALWCRNRNDVTRPGAREANIRTSHDDVGLFLIHCDDRITVFASITAYQMDATAKHSGERSCDLHRILVDHRRTDLTQRADLPGCDPAARAYCNAYLKLLPRSSSMGAMERRE